MSHSQTYPGWPRPDPRAGSSHQVTERSCTNQRRRRPGQVSHGVHIHVTGLTSRKVCDPYPYHRAKGQVFGSYMYDVYRLPCLFEALFPNSLNQLLVTIRSVFWITEPVTLLVDKIICSFHFGIYVSELVKGTSA